MKRFITVIVLLLLFAATAKAQQPYQPPPRKEFRNSTGEWFGFYTKYHFNDKWAYYGEYHVRLKDNFEHMGQVYLRMGATYKIARYLDFTAGIVNPYYWAPDQKDPNLDKVVPQYRLWQQAVLATPFDHIRVFHQLRTEQRYRRDYRKGSDFELTHRFRYKLTVYVPLNKKELSPKTLFLAMYEEIFIQAGKTVIYNHLEDNRLYGGLGYNISAPLQIQMGYMYTFRHDGAPHKFENRHIIRLSLYHHLDFHLDKHRKDRDIPIH